MDLGASAALYPQWFTVYINLTSTLSFVRISAVPMPSVGETVGLKSDITQTETP